MKLPRILLATGLAALALPAVASADSIVYIDQGNVWSAEPDGSHKVQLTTGGTWHSPTQSDDGRIAAVQGTGPIQVMARDGQPLRTITTPPAKSGDGGTFAPEPGPALLLARRHEDRLRVSELLLPGGLDLRLDPALGLLHARDVTTATPHSVYGNQHSVSNPEWVTNSRTLVFGGYGRQVAIDDLDAGDYNAKPWMVPNGDMGDGEVSRDGKRLAVTKDYGANTKLAFYAVSGNVATEFPPAYPDLSCSTTSGDEKFGDLSWSPDGSGIAYESSGGITISRFTKFLPGDCEAPNDFVLSATGTSPDWGPAAPPAAAYKPPVVTPPTTTNPGPVTPAPIAKPGAKFAIAKATASALRKGLAVRSRSRARGASRSPPPSPAARSRAGARPPSRPARSRSSSRRSRSRSRARPHPQVDLQWRGRDEGAEGALAGRFRADGLDRRGEPGEGEVQRAPGRAGLGLAVVTDAHAAEVPVRPDQRLAVVDEGVPAQEDRAVGQPARCLIGQLPGGGAARRGVEFLEFEARIGHIVLGRRHRVAPAVAAERRAHAMAAGVAQPPRSVRSRRCRSCGSSGRADPTSRSHSAARAG